MNELNKNELDKWTEACLVTWYPVEHELHLKPHHALKKLTGESGEYIDGDAKREYKPGWKFEDELGELGDQSYYLRVLFYQAGLNIEDIMKGLRLVEYGELSNDELLATVSYKASGLLLAYARNVRMKYKYADDMIKDISFQVELRSILGHWLTYVNRRGFYWEQICESNYEKLVNKDGTGKHGWKSVKEY